MRLSVFVLILTMMNFGAVHGAAKAPPIYTIQKDSEISLGALDNPCLAGITYYIGWMRIEPKPGNYDFNNLKALLREAKLKEKKVNIAILTGRWSPDWVYDAGAEKMSWRHTDRLTANDSSVPSHSPIPWDPTYTSELRKLISVLSSEIRPYLSEINSIAITGGSNTNGLELNLIGPDKELERIGFTSQRYEENWKQLIKLYGEAFPHTKLTIAIHIQYGESRTDEISKEILNYASRLVGDRLIISAYAFTEKSWFKPGNLYADMYFNNPQSAHGSLQTLINYSMHNQHAEFKKMLEKAQDISPAWIELWNSDTRPDYLTCSTYQKSTQ